MSTPTTVDFAKATITFETDILIWGASLAGESDPATLVSEYGEHWWHRGPLWDTEGHSGWKRNTYSGYMPVPLWWSLPWVARWIGDRNPLNESTPP